MKIYFAGSIRGGRDDAGLYGELIERLRAYGEVLTEHVGNPELTQMGDDGPDDRSIHDRDMAWLAAADVLVAEVTVPSLGVGYELGRAVEMEKPVLCLHRLPADRPLSAMVAGSSGIKTAAYADPDEAMKIAEAFFNLQSFPPPKQSYCGKRAAVPPSVAKLLRRTGSHSTLRSKATAEDGQPQKPASSRDGK